MLPREKIPKPYTIYSSGGKQNMMIKSFRLSLFPSRYSNKPKTIERPLDIAIQSLLTPVTGVSKKDSVPLWSPTIFNGNRSGDNAYQISMLVYDMDDGVVPFSSWRLFGDHCVLAHTSFSHTPQYHKYRIILPLEKPIPARDWSRASIAALRLWKDVVGRGEPDPKALKDIARMYYRYSIPLSGDLPKGDPRRAEEYHQAHFVAGPLLNLDYSCIEEPKKVQIREYKITEKVSMEDVMLDSSFRAAIADRLGAKIVSNAAKGIICPSCGRPDVVFSIDLAMPNSIKWPKCNHENKCKWWGSFEMLMGEK